LRPLIGKCCELLGLFLIDERIITAQKLN